MAEDEFYSLVYAEMDLRVAIARSISLRKAIAAGDPDAFSEVLGLARTVLEKVETRFLVGWAEIEAHLDERDTLISNASHRFAEMEMFDWGWNTGKLKDPWKDDPLGRYGSLSDG